MRTVYDFNFRMRYRLDVFLNTISLFKKFLRASPTSPISALLLATCFSLSARLLETRQPSHSEIIVLSLYAFTRDQLLDFEHELLVLLNYDICCNFADDIRGQLAQELR